jgi:hypothetical protein
MIPKLAQVLAALLVTASTVSAQTGAALPVSPRAYGSDTQTLVLGAAAFSPIGSLTYEYASVGYVYRTGGADNGMWAPVNLPNGAVVDHVCVSLFDSNGAADALVEWGLYELGSAVNLASFVPISSQTDDYNGGYHVFCVPDVPHTIRSIDDFDGDGIENSGAYRVAVYFPGTGNTIRLGGATIYYHLTVSPAPAVATFPVDVPTNHPFFRYIEALAEAGITAGTGPGAFSPDDPVTRGQMAVFLSIALGLHFPN